MNALLTNYTSDEIQQMLMKSKNDADEMIRDVTRLCEAANKDPKNAKIANTARQLILELYNEFDFQLYILAQLDPEMTTKSIASITYAKEQIKQRSGISYPMGTIAVAGM